MPIPVVPGTARVGRSVVAGNDTSGVEATCPAHSLTAAHGFDEALAAHRLGQSIGLVVERSRTARSSANSVVRPELNERPVSHGHQTSVPLEYRRSTFVSDMNRLSTHKKHSSSRWSAIPKIWKQRHCTYTRCTMPSRDGDKAKTSDEAR